MKTLLNNGTVIDGNGGVIENGSVLFTSDEILEVGPRKSTAEVDGDTKVVDVEGATILPGLMNLHVHIQRRHLHRKTDNEPFRTGTPALESQPDEVRMVWAIKNCWAELMEGITTFRDTGSGAALANKVRWVFDSGVMGGPRFVSSGEGIAITGGHGAHYPKQAALWADGADGVRQAVRYQLHLGSDWIKLMASSGLGGMPIFEDPRCTEMTLEEMKAGVREAHARRARVTVHAFYSEAVQAAIVSGVDCIEHGTSLNEETIDLMKKHRTCYVPTMSNMVELCRREEVAGDPKTAELIREASVTPHKGSVARAHAAGIRIGTGSDTMGQLHKEIEMLHEAGLSTMECIKAATSVAADILGMKKEIGSLEPGKGADILVCHGNPLDDLRALRNVHSVYKSGHLVTADWLVGTIQDAMSRPTLSTARPFYRRVSERYLEHEYMTVIS